MKIKYISLLFFYSIPLYAKETTTPEEHYNNLESFARAFYYIESLYVDETKVKPDQMIPQAIKGMVSQLDPHTALMPPKAFEQLNSETQGKFGGVGVVITQEKGSLIVVSPIDGTPAMKAGIKSGDKIIAIDDVPVQSTNINESIEKMKGHPGSILKLKITRQEEPAPLLFELKREIIKVHSVRFQKLANGLYYAKITSFQEETSAQLESFLKASEKDIKGLILDLRDNPGGLLDQSVKTADLFIESGVIVSTVGRDPDKIEREFAHKQGTFKGFPMITLINDGSASASEIVAGALQDHQRSLIMGTQSFGKGSVQTMLPLPNGSGLKLTIARYYTPKDRSIQAKGILPDIIVPKKKMQEEKNTSRKEADLKGHIESQNLSDLSIDSGILNAIKDWPEHFQTDNQIVTAFTYLKGWSIFQ